MEEIYKNSNKIASSLKDHLGLETEEVECLKYFMINGIPKVGKYNLSELETHFDKLNNEYFSKNDNLSNRVIDTIQVLASEVVTGLNSDYSDNSINQYKEEHSLTLRGVRSTLYMER